MLPSEARHYGFDRGLVLMAADARHFRIRGPGQKAVSYTPPPPATAPEGPLRANGTRELVPLKLFGEHPLRQVRLGGQWLGLYSEKEAADAGGDSWGQSLRYPWKVLDEGRTARRHFWRAKIETVKNFDDSYERLTELKRIDGAPTFLKGRFKAGPNPDEPLVLTEPESVLVWHSTRVDDAGRLAMTRLDARLEQVWKAELPLSETDAIRQVSTWLVPGHLVIVGALQTEDSGVTSRTPHLVSIDLANGAVRSRPLTEDAAE